MFTLLTIASLGAFSFVNAAPTDRIEKRSTPLSCVTYQFNGPFGTSGGTDGFIQLYANITDFHPDTQTTTFNETRLGLVDGTVQPCGECRTTEQFGFEVCEGSDRKGYDGLGNSPNFFYGHLLYRNVDTPRCIGSSRSAGSLDGVSLVVQDCKYDYETLKTNGQYWKMSVTDGVWQARLQYESLFGDSGPYGTWGPSADGKTLQEDLWDDFAYYGWKSQY